MVILGLYAGHDSNACLIKDGVVMAHVEGERTTRAKHQQGLIRRSIEGMFRYCGLTLDDVDIIAVGGTTVLKGPDPWDELENICGWVGEEACRRFVYPRLYGEGGESDARTVKGHVKRGNKVVTVILTDHHLSHVALAYYTSPYDRAKIISWDGGGDGAYTVLAKGEGNRISSIMYNPPNGNPMLSIGGAWTELGKLYGEGVGNGVDYEGKIMGHSAYGEPDVKLTQLCMMYMEEYQLLTTRMKEIVYEKIHGSVVTGYSYLNDFQSRECKTFSASLQRATELVMETITKSFVLHNDNLCLTGGCAYNCVANGKLWQMFPNTFVTNIPHDGGLSLGSALYVWYHVLGNEFKGCKWWSPYTGLGTGSAFPDVAVQVVSDLVDGKIVAWHNGRAEGGKRALGNRSILLDPRDRVAKDVLNARVKKREWFRPFAPSILPYKGLPPSPYMSFSCPMPNTWLGKVGAVVHVDGSCRPQIVSRESNMVYCKILELWEEATGVPMLLNTSLNIGEPICDSDEDSRRCFNKAAGGIDVLYINGKRSVWNS